MDVSSFQTSLSLVAEITALRYYGKIKPDFADMVQDAKKPIASLMKQLGPIFEELETTAELWLKEWLSDSRKKLEKLPKNSWHKIKEEENYLKRLSELEPRPTTNLSERIARDLPPKKGTLRNLRDSQFLVACAIYLGQLCGIHYLWPVRASNLEDFVLIFWEIEVAADAAIKEAAEEDNDAQNTRPISRGRKRQLNNDSKLDGEDPTKDTKPSLNNSARTTQPSTPLPKRLRQEMFPNLPTNRVKSRCPGDGLTARDARQPLSYQRGHRRSREEKARRIN
ncbi:hypothetical protein HJFPF1_13589 [Paramyrothecium foliicola]|nr:hypothetical protein HJFPF1_13589 [Paramyrothecium foliicola]